MIPAQKAYELDYECCAPIVLCGSPEAQKTSTTILRNAEGKLTWGGRKARSFKPTLSSSDIFKNKKIVLGDYQKRFT